LSRSVIPLRTKREPGILQQSQHLEFQVRAKTRAAE
jgi:hypothetical protein